MELENKTAIPSILWRTIIDDDRIAAAVVARITYDVVEGNLAIAEDQIWQVSNAVWESPIGTLPPESCFFRGGVDMMIFGFARALGAQPASKVEVRITLGDFSGGVDVYGKRYWHRPQGRRDKLTATSPEPFVELPLNLEHAFGGKQLWDGLEVPHTGNPEGMGWYFEEEAAVEQPLARIEDPGAPVIQWSDVPDPVGVGYCPQSFGPRVRRSTEFDDRGMLRKLRPTFFNDAFPDMIAPVPKPGVRCVVSGMRVAGDLSFCVPNPPLLVRLSIGNTDVQRLLQIDQIGVEPDINRVFITYRFPFRYAVVPLQSRSCELHWCPDEHNI